MASLLLCPHTSLGLGDRLAYDSCYHQACDTFNNLNDTSFDQLAGAAATVLVLYGITKDPVTTTTLSKEAARATAAKTEYRGPRLQR